MRKLLLLVFCLPALTSVARADSPFDGTWKVNVESAKFPAKPDVLVLKDGRYQCSTCIPKIDVKADGSDQKVEGTRAFDTEMVKVVDDHTVQAARKKGGKVVAEQTLTVSADGKTMTGDFTEYPPESKEPVKGKVVMERVAQGPAGSHGISGSWRTQRVPELSQNALTRTYQSTANGLKMSEGTGASYEAQFDGKDYPIKGDPEASTVSIRKVDERTLEETIKRDGKVVNRARAAVATDGKTMNITIDDVERGTTASIVAEKQ